MEFVTEHWLGFGVGVFLLAMALYGHYRGFIRLAVAMLALIVSLFVMRLGAPLASQLILRNNQVQAEIGRSLLEAAGMDEEEIGAQLPAQQRAAIEGMKLPPQMKEVLLENNNSEIYQLLGVDAFSDYLGSCMANMVVNTIGSVVLFFLAYVLIKLGIRWLNLLSRLPVIHGMNQLAGAALGVTQGLVIVWAAGLVVRACAALPWAQTVIDQIEKTGWLRFLYHNNIFNWLFLKILSSLA